MIIQHVSRNIRSRPTEFVIASKPAIKCKSDTTWGVVISHVQSDVEGYISLNCDAVEILLIYLFSSYTVHALYQCNAVDSINNCSKQFFNMSSQLNNY